VVVATGVELCGKVETLAGAVTPADAWLEATGAVEALTRGVEEEPAVDPLGWDGEGVTTGPVKSKDLPTKMLPAAGADTTGAVGVSVLGTTIAAGWGRTAVAG